MKSRGQERVAKSRGHMCTRTCVQVYRRDDRCLPPKPDPEEGFTKKELIEKKEAAKGYEKPFVQSHPAKKGYNA